MIENKQVYISYIADGAQTEWEWPYQYVDSTDIDLYIKHDGTLTKISSSLYSFNLETNKIIYPSTPGADPVPADDIVLLTRDTDVTQLEDSTIANFKSNDVERIADKLTMICQELQDGYNRSIKYDQLDIATGKTDAASFVTEIDGHIDYKVAQHNTSAGAHTAKFAAKQDVIADLTTIRSNATAGKSASDTIATYGDIVTHNASEFATASQGAKADTALQQSDVTSSYSATGTAPVNGTAVASAVAGEASLRQTADNNLQSQIDAITAGSDVVDVVATYADFQSYDTSKLTDKDLIKVLIDSTHDDATTYYRWSKTNSSFSYVGSEGSCYTKAQSDNKFLTKTDASSTYIDNTELTTALATKASSADGTTITDSGSAISTVAVKEQRANTAIKQWVGTKAQYTALESKDANTVYVITDETDVEAITVDSALSSTSIHPVQNKAIYTALQGKQDNLVSGTNIKTINNNSLLGSGNISINQIEYATYQSTTWAQVNTWVTAGKTVLVKYNNKIYSLYNIDTVFNFFYTDGTATYILILSTDDSWIGFTFKPLPAQSGNSGKFLTTDGTSASWATVPAGAPTLTWYTGNTGATVTISDTSSADLVKIYKNGLLLQPTEDYTISGTTLTLVTALVSTDKITVEVF